LSGACAACKDNGGVIVANATYTLDFGDGKQSPPIDPALVDKLAQFRRAAHDLEEYVQTRNDVAFLNDMAAGVNRKLAHHALREANATIPPVTPDRSL